MFQQTNIKPVDSANNPPVVKALIPAAGSDKSKWFNEKNNITE